MSEVVTLIRERFSGWKAGRTPEKNIASVDQKSSSTVYLMDRPGALQSVIFAGQVAPPRSVPNQLAIEVMNTVLGGAFVSRINMNLREDKSWSYGAQTVLLDARGQRPFFVYAPVQTDKTSESMTEILRELRGIKGGSPPTAGEVARAKENMTLTLPGLWETNNAVENAIGELVDFNLPENYYDTYTKRVRGLSVDGVSAAAREVLYPDRLVWVVVGDRSVIEPGIRELGLGPIQIIDGDGNPVAEGSE
jgi:zinc protease